MPPIDRRELCSKRGGSHNPFKHNSCGLLGCLLVYGGKDDTERHSSDSASNIVEQKKITRDRDKKKRRYSTRSTAKVQFQGGKHQQPRRVHHTRSGPHLKQTEPEARGMPAPLVPDNDDIKSHNAGHNRQGLEHSTRRQGISNTTPQCNERKTLCVGASWRRKKQKS